MTQRELLIKELTEIFRKKHLPLYGIDVIADFIEADRKRIANLLIGKGFSWTCKCKACKDIGETLKLAGIEP